MTTVIVKLKFNNPLFDKNGYSTVEKLKIMFIDCNTFETKLSEIDYLPPHSITDNESDEVDSGIYDFTNIQYEKINKKIKKMFKNVETILYKDLIDRKYLNNFVSDAVQFIKVP